MDVTLGGLVPRTIPDYWSPTTRFFTCLNALTWIPRRFEVGSLGTLNHGLGVVTGEVWNVASFPIPYSPTAASLRCSFVL
jgi:hypothetical protein